MPHDDKTNEINIDILRSDPINVEIPRSDSINIDIDSTKTVVIGGDYPPLRYKPQINSIELIGNKTSKQLKLQDEMDAMTIQEIEKILYLD